MILKQYQFFVFSPPIDHAVKVHKMNPKKKQRMIHREVSSVHMSTQSQRALSLQYEQMKVLQKHQKSQTKMKTKEKLYQLKQQKKKQKHREH